MFTGIVQHVGVIASVTPTDTGVRLTLDPAGWDHAPARGDSIACNGCCLTLADEPRPGQPWCFDAIPETLAKTTLGAWSEGTRVNLEHAATMATLLGGHLVQGHVDGVGEVLGVETGEGWRVRVGLPAALMPYAVPKGSIALEGVSLTLAAVEPRGGWIEVALIPETLTRTTLGALKPGDPVNIEMDQAAKTIVHWLENFAEQRGLRGLSRAD
ncbi:MAG: riboflavin synthase [Phycisphaerales bacterium JB037]